MNADVIRTTRRHLRLSRQAFATLVGVADGRTVARWEKDQRDVPESVIRFLGLLEKMTDIQRQKYMENLGVTQKP